MRFSLITKFVFAFTFAGPLGLLDAAHAQRSKRVLRDLAVQNSTEVGTGLKSSETAPATEDGTAGQLPAGAAVPIGWMASTGQASTAPTGLVASTGAPGGADNQGAQIMQSILGAFGGKGTGGASGPAGTAARAEAASPANSTSQNAGNSSGANPPSSQSGGSRRADQVDPNKPLPTDTNVEGRDCSATRKTWQPFTSHPFRLTSCFGHRRSTHRHHNGIDVVIHGQPQSINPVAPGKIVRAGLHAGYGCEIILEHDSCPAGIGGTKCYSQYAHLKKDKNGKCPGAGRIHEKVNPCTVLALMGNTGASKGAHLHFEVRTNLKSETAQDPNKVFKEWQAHKNYQKEASTCGTVGHGKAPLRQTPAKPEGVK